MVLMRMRWNLMLPCRFVLNGRRSLTCFLILRMLCDAYMQLSARGVSLLFASGMYTFCTKDVLSDLDPTGDGGVAGSQRKIIIPRFYSSLLEIILFSQPKNVPNSSQRFPLRAHISPPWARPPVESHPKPQPTSLRAGSPTSSHAPHIRMMQYRHTSMLSERKTMACSTRLAARSRMCLPKGRISLSLRQGRGCLWTEHRLLVRFLRVWWR